MLASGLPKPLAAFRAAAEGQNHASHALEAYSSCASMTPSQTGTFIAAPALVETDDIPLNGEDATDAGAALVKRAPTRSSARRTNDQRFV